MALDAGRGFPGIHGILGMFARTRFILCIFLGLFTILALRTIRETTGNYQKFYCFGPNAPPTELTSQQQRAWEGRLPTPVLYNNHKPVYVDPNHITGLDLNRVTNSPNAAQKGEVVLILTPLRDAAEYLRVYFDLLINVTYPHELIDLAFLVGDSRDDTHAVLVKELERIQKDPKIKFRDVQIVLKDFGVTLSQDVHDRHAFEAQGPRRKALGRARNYLLYTALKPDHSWVHWRDADAVESPASIIEDLIEHNKDIIVPNIWFHKYDENGIEKEGEEGRFDYNQWSETDESRMLTANLEREFVLAEGYSQYNTHRIHMAALGSAKGDPKEEMELDGVGGVFIMVKADVHRSGINFPCYAFENQAETEGFAKMAKRAGYSVVGLPNYIVWHFTTGE